MPARTPDPAAAEQVRRAFERKIAAELAAADALSPGSDVIPPGGALIAQVMLVKGLAGPAEISGAPALSGPDGVAADKALEALTWPSGSWFATVARPVPEEVPERVSARLLMQVEAVDPYVVVALDEVAASELARAFALESPLRWGEIVAAQGRRLLAVDGLEAALADEGRKRRVWRQLKAAAPPPPVF